MFNKKINRFFDKYTSEYVFTLCVETTSRLTMRFFRQDSREFRTGYCFIDDQVDSISCNIRIINVVIVSVKLTDAWAVASLRVGCLSGEDDNRLVWIRICSLSL